MTTQMQTRTLVDVAVVGGGLSGSLAAVQLLRQARGLRVALVDRDGRFGRGVAYATKQSAHLLNVPAGRMSALPDDPSGFVRWLAARGFDAAPDAFVPRALFGRYVAELLEETTLEATRTGGGTLIRIARRAMRVSGGAAGGPSTVELEGGMRLSARAVVLALGNFAPRDPDVDGLEEVSTADRYRRDPWDPRTLQGLGQDEPVLLLGTGLTMIDVCLALDERGHRGTVHALSPRGLLPLPHLAGLKPVTAPDLSGPKTVRNLLRRVREGIAAAAENGDDWRAVLDSLRPATASLWAALPTAERRRFLRHARRYWDRHRHRIAPEADPNAGDATERQRLVLRRRFRKHAHGSPAKKRATRLSPSQLPGRGTWVGEPLFHLRCGPLFHLRCSTTMPWPKPGTGVVGMGTAHTEYVVCDDGLQDVVDAVHYLETLWGYDFGNIHIRIEDLNPGAPSGQGNQLGETWPLDLNMLPGSVARNARPSAGIVIDRSLVPALYPRRDSRWQRGQLAGVLAHEYNHARAGIVPTLGDVALGIKEAVDGTHPMGEPLGPLHRAIYKVDPIVAAEYEAYLGSIEEGPRDWEPSWKPE